MWYFSQYNKIDDENKDKRKQWEEKINSIYDIQDLEERLDYIYDIMSDFRKSEIAYDFDYNDIYKKIISITDETKDKIREITGEPEFDFNNIYTFPEWLEWKEKIGGKESAKNNIPYLISELDELYTFYGEDVYYRPTRYEKSRQISQEESEKVLGIKQYLQDKAFNLLNIDINKLSDPESWKAEGFGTEEKTLGFTKVIDWLPEGKDEGVITSFTITPSGISILSEVSENPMPTQLQKSELNKFINDVNNFFPKDWNKDINYIEGGDFEAILSGKLDKDIKVYRMMSDKEFNNWERGEIIPVGKYFALKREYAVGTDFSGEGFRNVFAFIINRGLLSGADENVVISNVPLKLKNNRFLVQA